MYPAIDDSTPHHPLMSAAWLAKHASRAPEPIIRRLRAATYGRISTLEQLETSIDRQTEKQVAYIEANAWDKVGGWEDRDSGAHTVNREGLLAMLEAARANAFDVLVVEEIDRLGRDIGILGTVHRELTDLGIEIHGTVQGRKLDATDVALRGLQAQETRNLFIYRTQSGRDKAALKGSAGRLWWGLVRTGVPGQRKKDPEICAIIVEMYRMRLDGLSHGAIAKVLDARGILSPKGKKWSASQVGKLLANPAYKGVMVYNRTRKSKPLNGKAVAKPRPLSDWIIVGVPAIAVVTPEVWEEAQVPPSEPRPKWRRDRYLLSLRVRCPECQGTMQVFTRKGRGTVLKCGEHQARGTCTHPNRYPMDVVEREVVAIVRSMLADPELEQVYVNAFEEERLALERRVKADRVAVEGRLAEIDRQTKASFIAAVTAGLATEDVVAMRQELNRESAELRHKLHTLPRPPAALPAPQRLQTLREAFDMVFEHVPFRPMDEAGHRVMSTFSELVRAVTIQPDDIGRGYRLVVETCLPALLQGTTGTGEGDPPAYSVQGRWLSGRTLGMPHAHQEARIAEAASSGEFDMDDRTWALVEPLIPQTLLLQRGRPPLESFRPVVDALLFVLRTGHPLYRFPARYGPRCPTFNAIVRLVQSGVWEAIVQVLQERSPGFLEGVELGAAERYRRNRARLDRKALAAADR